MEIRNAALSSTNIRDYVYKGKCLLPVQETGLWWASDVWWVSLRCKQVMGEGCVGKRNGEIDSFHLVFLVKITPPSSLLTKQREEVAEQKISDVQNRLD